MIAPDPAQLLSIPLPATPSPERALPETTEPGQEPSGEFAALLALPLSPPPLAVLPAGTGPAPPPIPRVAAPSPPSIPTAPRPGALTIPGAIFQEAATETVPPAGTPSESGPGAIPATDPPPLPERPLSGPPAPSLPPSPAAAAFAEVAPLVAPAPREHTAPVSPLRADAPQPTPPPPMVQVAVAIAGHDSARLELRLDPPELGRVQIELRHTDSGVQATIIADRPETGDLLRRHGADLTRELLSAGFGSVDLAFSSGGQPEDDRPPAPPAALLPLAEAATAAGDPARTGLDIRL